MTKIISVFGSSAPMPGSEAYEQAQNVGQLLAAQGFAVATGGYAGTMAAVSQGAAAAGGKVIGVTCTQIERFRPIKPNQWVNEEIKYETLSDRLLHLVRENAGMIVLPGGIGTLSEFALAWSLLQVDEITLRPLLLLGEMWPQTIHTFAQAEYVPDRHLALLRFVDSAEEAAAALTA